MIKVLEIGRDIFFNKDNARSVLHKSRRIECAKHLKSYDVILHSPYSSGSIRKVVEADNLTVYYVGGNRLFSFFRILLLALKISAHKKIDVSSSIDPYTYGIICYVLRFVYKIPMNIQLHFDYFSEYTHRSFLRYYYAAIRKFVLLNSDSIRVVSGRQRDSLRKMKIKNKLIEIIPTPVDINRLRKIKVDPSICSQYRVSKNTKLLLFVGRLEYQKDLTVLFKAFRIVRDTYGDVKLLLIGSGSIEGELRRISEGLEINQDVLFLGSIDNALVFSYYYGCDIVVMTSKFEGRPTVLTEAVLSKKPIVSTRFSGSEDVIIDGETGFIVDIKDYERFAEKILILLKNSNMMCNFGQMGYDHFLKKLEKVNTLKALVNLWEKTVL